MNKIDRLTKLCDAAIKDLKHLPRGQAYINLAAAMNPIEVKKMLTVMKAVEDFIALKGQEEEYQAFDSLIAAYNEFIKEPIEQTKELSK